MKIEDQVSNPELSKKLRDLGVPQESAFYWVMNDHLPKDHTFFNMFQLKQPHQFSGGVYFSAFTVAELIDLLGPNFGVLERFQHSGKFGAYIPNDIGTSSTGEKVADVLGELLLQTYENEQGIITP